MTKRRRGLVMTGVIAAGMLAPLVSTGGAVAATRSLCAPPADTVPPTVTNVTLGSTTVDLQSNRKLAITADVVDTSANSGPSGVKLVSAEVDGPHGYAETRLHLTSGTSAEGDWTGTFTIPKTGDPGAWKVQNIYAEDNENNYQNYSQYGKYAEGPTDIRLQSGWQTTFTVTGTTTPRPKPKRIKPGKLLSFGFSPGAVNTTEHSKRVTVTAEFSKPYPSRAYAYFERTNRSRHYFNSEVRLKQVDGEDFSGHITVPRWIGNTTLRAELNYFYDNAGPNGYKDLDSDDLQSRHFPTKLKVTSLNDNKKPALQTLTFSPTSIDTTGGAQTLTATATGSDALSGVKSIRVDLDINHGFNGAATGFYPYAEEGIGYEQDDYQNIDLKPVGSDGTFTGTTKFAECVPSGNYKVTAYVEDHADNEARYSTKQLATLGLPSTVAVTATPGDVEDPYVRSSTSSAADKTITLDFSEGVKNVSTSTLSVYADSPAKSRYTSALSVSGIVCNSGDTPAVPCDGSGGLVTSAVLAVPDVTSGASYEVYANADSVTPQLTDGNGNPLPWDYEATDVTGS